MLCLIFLSLTTIISADKVPQKSKLGSDYKTAIIDVCIPSIEGSEECLNSNSFINEYNGPIVEISSGKIRGQFVKNTKTNSTYYAFQGIPYAKPPIGKLRFQAAVAPEPWSYIKSTTKDANFCVQFNMGSEDCLYINVFTNHLPSERIAPMPVMFWIHGGAFHHGSQNASFFGPEYLLKKDVVFVTFNYRLNVFGFLNTMDNAASANAGLKDQVLALRWVRDNIAKFNGDPNCVTIIGHSAGAASVQFLIYSKLAEGLFHRTISVSGSALNYMAVQLKPIENMLKLKNKLNISSNNTKEIVEKLQSLDAYEVYTASMAYTPRGENNILSSFPFVPSIEHDHTGAIIAKPSIESLMNGNVTEVPHMAGYVTGESFMFMPEIARGNLNLSDFALDKSLLLSPLLYIKHEDEDKAINGVLNKYFKNSSVEDETMFLKYQTQNMFIAGIRNSVEKMCNLGKVYLYRYSYKGSLMPNIPEVIHTEMLMYIFNMDFVNPTAKDKQTIEYITTSWTNFAKTGDPNSNDSSVQSIDWKPFTKDEKNYLEIGNEIFTSTNPDEEDFLFWKDIIKKYSKYPHIVD